VQATAADSLRADVARDLYAVLVHLMKCSQLDAFRELDLLELSFTQIKALHALDGDEGEELSLKQLAERLGISLPSASRCVDGLYQRGFVDRREDPEDRRMKRVRIRDEGRNVTGALNQTRLSAVRDFAQSLAAEDAARLAAALAPLAERPDIAACRPED